MFHYLRIMAYEKKPGMQCLVEGSVILKNQTLLTALTYCASDIGCAKVYDFECDGRGTFLLCKRWNNEFFNHHLDGVEKWAIFRKVSRTKFLNTLEQNQLLASSCLYSKHSENNNCDPSIHNCDCPWEYQTTKQDDVLLCNDGYSCNGQTHPEGYGCCNRHLGRALCMRNSPFMCNHTGACDSIAVFAMVVAVVVSVRIVVIIVVAVVMPVVIVVIMIVVVMMPVVIVVIMGLTVVMTIMVM